MAEETINVPVKDWDQLIALITEQNRKHDSVHSDIIDNIKFMNAEHEKRYNEFFKLTNKILAQLRQKVKSQEKRIDNIEQRLEGIEEKIGI
jgi:hypothetical protein